VLARETGRLLGATLATNKFRDALNELFTKPPPTGVLPWHVALLSGFFAALDKRGLEFNLDAFSDVMPSNRPSTPVSRAKAIEQKAVSLCTDRTAALELRQAAVELTARLPIAGDTNVLLRMLDPKQPAVLQATAVRAIARSKDERNPAELLKTERWDRFTPTVREAILDAMLSNPRHVPTLLTAIESGGLSAGLVNSARRKQLLQNRDELIRQRAAALFKNPGPTDRMRVFEDNKSVLSLSAIPTNGREVFKRTCSSCHRLDREGVPVGPDLFSIRNQSKETILLHIVIPEYEILPGFVNYLVETTDGRSLSGIIAAESPQAVTLRKALAEEETIGRSNIVSLTSSGLSMMPQELEKVMSKQELADLLAYLKGE
jgi:putative heme-binding domain-containing protein